MSLMLDSTYGTDEWSDNSTEHAAYHDVGKLVAGNFVVCTVHYATYEAYGFTDNGSDPGSGDGTGCFGARAFPSPRRP